MDASTLVDLLSRWIHVVSAIVLLGGSVFVRYVLIPSGAGEDISRFGARWKRIVMIGIALLLITGLYNYIGRDRPPQYHMLMGIKMLLAFGVFFLASALTGRSAGLAGIRANPARWLTLLISLGMIVVAIASYLKVVVQTPA